MLITVFSFYKLVAVSHVLHVFLESHNGFIFLVICKHMIIGRFHLKMYFSYFFLEKNETFGNIKSTFSTDGACALWYISSHVDYFSPLYNLSDPNKQFHCYPWYTEKAFRWREKEQKRLKTYILPITHLPQYKLVKTVLMRLWIQV